MSFITSVDSVRRNNLTKSINKMISEVKENRGGARVGSGRPPKNRIQTTTAINKSLFELCKTEVKARTGSMADFLNEVLASYFRRKDEALEAAERKSKEIH